MLGALNVKLGDTYLRSFLVSNLENLEAWTISVRVNTSPVLTISASVTDVDLGEVSFSSAGIPVGIWNADIHFSHNTLGTITTDTFLIECKEGWTNVC